MRRITAMPNTHELKCDPEPFLQVWDGIKKAEVRQDDRGFAVYDTIRLKETMPGDRSRYTGRQIGAVVTHIQKGYGLPVGLVVMSIHVFARVDG